jgi:MoxR-like ATPase
MTKDTNILIHDVLEIQPAPDQYLLDLPLQKAVETALRFNQPLLLTGEPGTGKTQLAYKVAHQLHQQTLGNGRAVFAEKPLRFNTKTTSQARDLFYLYDAIGHFQQANTRLATGGPDKAPLRPTADFIELQALGEAIARANPKAEYTQQFRFSLPETAVSSVVLIDEVDKAPRDFTNDILNEIENREFYVKEQDNYKVELGRDNTQRILLIMTSNSEKNLPEAFLRRCVFYHIPSPEGEKLRNILKAHLTLSHTPALEKSLDNITAEFETLRKKVTRKAPATAELVALVKLLEVENAFSAEITDVKKVFRENLSLLIKTKEDLEAVRDFLNM